MLEKLFFASGENLLRIVIAAPILYAAMIAFIRISGKRTTSQMNNFDWIVTVAMGSMFASAIVFKEVTVIEVLLALSTLLALQYVVTRKLRSSELLQKLVKARPALLFRNGEFIDETMKSERITEGEVRSAIRGSGIAAIDDVEAVILESDASMSVIPREEGRDLRNMTALGELRTSPGAGND